MKRSVIGWMMLAGVFVAVMGVLCVWLPLYDAWQTSEAALTDMQTRLARLSTNAAPVVEAAVKPMPVYRAQIQRLLMQAEVNGVVLNAVEVPTAAGLGTHFSGEAPLPAFEAWLHRVKSWRLKRLSITRLNNGRVAFQFYAAAPVAFSATTPSPQPSLITPFCQQLTLPEAMHVAATPERQRVSWHALQWRGAALQHGQWVALFATPAGSLISAAVGDQVGLELAAVVAVSAHAVMLREQNKKIQIIEGAHG